jgi:hypothetical protein
MQKKLQVKPLAYDVSQGLLLVKIFIIGELIDFAI